MEVDKAIDNFMNEQFLSFVIGRKINNKITIIDQVPKPTLILNNIDNKLKRLECFSSSKLYYSHKPTTN